jgi:transposase-like protein
VSKARLVITAVVVEGRSQSEVAREYGASQGWISRLVARYRAEGEAAFEPQSRRPDTSPTKLDADVEIVTVVIEDTHLRVMHGEEEIAVRPRRNLKPITRFHVTGAGANNPSRQASADDNPSTMS